VSIRKRLINLAKANASAIYDRASSGFRDDRFTKDRDPDYNIGMEEVEADLHAAQRRLRQAAGDLKRHGRRAHQQVRERVEAVRVKAEEALKDAWGQARSRAMAHSPHLEEHYHTLQVPPGSSIREVQLSYRKLMRRYHPDLYPPGSRKHAIATRKSKSLTIAYNALKQELSP